MGIKGVDSGFRKTLAQIPMLPFVSLNKLFFLNLYFLICKMGIKVEPTQWIFAKLKLGNIGEALSTVPSKCLIHVSYDLDLY